MDWAFNHLDTKFSLPERQPMATKNGAFSDVFKRNPGPVKDMANLLPSNLVRFRHRFGHELEPSHFRFTRSFNLQAHPK